jgi:hypothetical protein
VAELLAEAGGDAAGGSGNTPAASSRAVMALLLRPVKGIMAA